VQSIVRAYDRRDAVRADAQARRDAAADRAKQEAEAKNSDGDSAAE